jgi:DNA-binding LacI/PurR family transcriptional regulator
MKNSSQLRSDSTPRKRAARITIREIAAQTGFSKSLVALAIKNDQRVAEATRKNISAVARKIGYQKNPVVAHLMFQLRQSRDKAYQANLALISCARTPNTFRWHTNSLFRRGFCEAAGRLGYGVDDFWLNQPGRSFRQLARILRSRRIAGLALVAARDLDTIQRSYDDIWRDFPVIGIGIVRTRPSISCVCTDHFQTTMVATEEVLRRGYRRPGLFIKRGMDQLVDQRFSGGFLAVTQRLKTSHRTEIYSDNTPDLASFGRWLRQERPDCILTLHPEVRGWLADLGRTVPDAMGLVHLDWNEDLPDWAGMVQNSRQVGETAAELVIQSRHGNQNGAPPDPRVIMVDSHWRGGPSIAGPA